jgi:hypothetical protein
VVSCRERKKVGMLFAHLKRILRLDRLRQRGPNGAKYEFLLAATAQNLRKLRSSSRSRRPYSPHEAEGLGFASPATTSGAHRHLQSTGYFNDPLIAAVCFAQIAAGRRWKGERAKHAFKMGAMNGRKRRESGRRRYWQDALNEGFPRLHTERASSTLFRRSGEHEDGTEARDRFGPIVAADATSFPPSALHLDRLC